MRSLVTVLLWISFLNVGCHKKAAVPDPPTNPAPEITVDYTIAPLQTDAAITMALDSHFVSVKHYATLKNVLFVFLPGTNRQPKDYQGIVHKAASMGYHAIGLMYPNRKAVNTLCAPTNDTTCHRRARLEIVDGIDRHPVIDVNAANAIISRLVKLLQWLDASEPAEHWAQYVKNGQPDWTKIMVSGHSQGAGNAALIGKYYPVRKVILFSIVDYLSDKKLADWEDLPANKEKYYALFNPKDELLYYYMAERSWQHLGMTGYGGIVNVDSAPSPYGNTHTLITRISPSLDKNDKFHNSTAVDSYLTKDNAGVYALDKAWEYLLKDETP